MTFISSASRIVYTPERATNETGAFTWGDTTLFNTLANHRSFGILAQDIELPDVQHDLRTYRSFGKGREFYKVIAGRRTRTANIPFIPTNGAFLYYAFGHQSVLDADTSIDNNNDGDAGDTGETAGTAGMTAPFTHRLMPLGCDYPSGQSPPTNVTSMPSMTLGVTLERASNNFQRIFAGGTVNSLSMSVAEGGELTCAYEMIYKGHINTSNQIADAGTYGHYGRASATMFTQVNPQDETGTDDDTAVPYMYYDRDSSISIGANNFARVKAFTCSIRNNLKPHYFLGSDTTASKEVGLITTGYPDFDLSMTIVPDGHKSAADALYEVLEGVASDASPATYTAPTTFNVSLPFKRGTNDELTLTFSDCMLRSAPHSLPADGAEINVTASIQPRRVTATVKDSYVVNSVNGAY